MPGKQYIDYLDEISSDELYGGLLCYGLFTEKLPPVFKMENFCSYVPAQPYSEKTEHGFIYFESVRDINIPRPLGIPNPMAYQMLCRCLADNWDNIKTHFRNQTFADLHKVSRIHIRKLKDSKAVFKMNYNNWKSDDDPIPDLLIGKHYRVSADISTCFPSMYSHAVPWALVGVDVAKANRNPVEWFNQIDHYCMKVKNGETHGFLIGPHASNLLSEIILTVVDRHLVTDGWKYIRHIDDYTCYVTSYEKAQEFLRDLNMHLREFDLPLNHKKTKIEELPLASTNDWVHQLNAVELIASFGKVSYKTARAYLDTAIKLMYENGQNAAVINYAVKTLAGQNLTDNAKRYCLKTICHLAVARPYLVSLLEEFVFEPYGADEKDIRVASEYLYEVGIKDANFEACVYAIYFAIKHGISLKCVKANDAVINDSCLLKLFVFLYFNKINEAEEIRKLKQHARDLLTACKEPRDMDRYWLFIYECLPKSNLKWEWKPMKEAGVTFIKDTSAW